MHHEAETIEWLTVWSIRCVVSCCTKWQRSGEAHCGNSLSSKMRDFEFFFLTNQAIWKFPLTGCMLHFMRFLSILESLIINIPTHSVPTLINNRLWRQHHLSNRIEWHCAVWAIETQPTASGQHLCRHLVLRILYRRHEKDRKTRSLTVSEQLWMSQFADEFACPFCTTFSACVKDSYKNIQHVSGFLTNIRPIHLQTGIEQKWQKNSIWCKTVVISEYLTQQWVHCKSVE